MAEFLHVAQFHSLAGWLSEFRVDGGGDFGGRAADSARLVRIASHGPILARTQKISDVTLSHRPWKPWDRTFRLPRSRPASPHKTGRHLRLWRHRAPDTAVGSSSIARASSSCRAIAGARQERHGQSCRPSLDLHGGSF